MLPTLSRLSVSYRPRSRLRRRYSSRYLRISLLHLEFCFSLLHSRFAVSKAVLRLSRRISPRTWQAACGLFTPNKSGQRSTPTYYRGCWHVVSRCFGQVPSLSSSLFTALYNPKAFITHAASLRQGCPHCARFLTAASRRSLGRISVPVWPFTLSGRLPIVAMVGHYPTIHC